MTYDRRLWYLRSRQILLGPCSWFRRICSAVTQIVLCSLFFVHCTLLVKRFCHERHRRLKASLNGDSTVLRKCFSHLYKKQKIRTVEEQAWTHVKNERGWHLLYSHLSSAAAAWTVGNEEGLGGWITTKPNLDRIRAKHRWLGGTNVGYLDRNAMIESIATVAFGWDISPDQYIFRLRLIKYYLS